MALSRKQKRELARLKNQAADLWEDQKDVLERANKIVREAGVHAGHYARNDVAPRVRENFEERVAPVLASGAAHARVAAGAGRDRLVEDVLPAMSSALGSTLAVLDVAKDPHVREVLGRASRRGREVASRAHIPTRSSRSSSGGGAGRYVLLGIGIAALVGVAYVAWQTLRPDEDLWIDDEEFTEPGSDIQPS